MEEFVDKSLTTLSIIQHVLRSLKDVQINKCLVKMFIVCPIHLWGRGIRYLHIYTYLYIDIYVDINTIHV